MYTIDQKRAFHERTHEVLEKTEYSNIVNNLQIAYQNKKIDEETVKYVILSIFSISTQVRAMSLGIDTAELRYTNEEVEQNNRYMGGPPH